MNSDLPKESRHASRIILIDARKRVLFLRATEPNSEHSFWVMPGGGLDTGESFDEAAIREAKEESGCTFILGPYVWFRRHIHVWNGKKLDQYERFFVAKASNTEYQPSQQDDYISDHKWWSLDEMWASSDSFAPGNIRNIIGPILNGEYPSEPEDCGI